MARPARASTRRHAVFSKTGSHPRTSVYSGDIISTRCGASEFPSIICLRGISEGHGLKHVDFLGPEQRFAEAEDCIVTSKTRLFNHETARVAFESVSLAPCLTQMDDTFSKGFPFELGDIWLKSTLQPDKDDESLFPQLDTALPELELRNAVSTSEEIFHIPALGHVNDSGEQALESIESEIPSPLTAPTEPEAADLWTLNFEDDDVRKLPQLLTWETFDRKPVPDAERTAYLSESGPEAFSSALQHADQKSACGALPHNVSLRALCNLALGRSSIFFQWDDAKKTFLQTLEDTPIVGYSLQGYQDLVNVMIELGSALRLLADFSSNSATLRRSSPAIIAFKDCLSSIVDGVEEHIATCTPHLRSILQLQSVTERPLQLIRLITALKDLVEGSASDEEIISKLFDRVQHITEAGTCLSDVLRVSLDRVSAPWLERLCENMGLGRSQSGRARLISARDSEQAEIDEVDASFEQSSHHGEILPAFVSSEDRSLILETKASLRILQRHLPDLDLASPEFIDVRNDLFHGNYRASSSQGNMESDVAFGSAIAGQSNLSASIGQIENLPWAGHDVRLEYFTSLDARISRDPNTADRVVDELRLSVKLALEDRNSQIAGLEQSLEYSPLERLRPIIQKHKRLMDRALLRHLFVQCRLRHHLDLQRQYHLFGDGDFAARLSIALFSDETQTAERKRGTIPTGEPMGLRLGVREGQRWPPASSELRLTLMGVLNETYRSEGKILAHRRKTKEMPGGLSFSVRELPDEQIDRVLDSGSIYALDFLRLQYTAPPALEAVLTPASMQAYDSIFRFLLRLLRVLHVTTRLHEQARSSRGTRSQGGSPITGVAEFAIEAHQCLSVLISHFMDLGITAQWRPFTAALSAVESALDDNTERRRGNGDEIIGLDGLRQLHENCLGRIRSRLFLRRKQEKLCTAVEDVLTAVLRCASALQRAETDSSQTDWESFRASKSTLCTLLSTAVDKPLKGNSNNADEGDVDAMRILLGMLR